MVFTSFTPIKPGHGVVHLTLLQPCTPRFSTLSDSYPLKLSSSTPHTLRAAPTPLASSSTSPTAPIRPTNVPLLFLISYGGGLLPPESIVLTIILEPSTRLTITTQGSTKVFPSPDSAPHAIATQTLSATLSAHSALWLGPDPVQPYDGSHYMQTQTFDVVDGASLGIVDWVNEGRRARGESWVAKMWKAKNEVWRVGKEGEQSYRKLLLRDSLVLDGEREGEVAQRMEGLGVFGTVLLVGPVLEALGTFFVEEFEVLPRIGGQDWGDGVGIQGLEEREVWRRERWKNEKRDGIVWTAARVRGCVVVKFGTREMDGAKKWLSAMLRMEGTVATEFGEGGLMCVS